MERLLDLERLSLADFFFFKTSAMTILIVTVSFIVDGWAQQTLENKHKIYKTSY